MAGDIDYQRNLEAEHVVWIEWTKCNQKTSSAAAIRQLIQHATEFGA